MAGKLISSILAFFFQLTVALAQARAQGPSKAWKKFSSALKNHFKEVRYEEAGPTDTIPTRDEGRCPFLSYLEKFS